MSCVAARSKARIPSRCPPATLRMGLLLIVEKFIASPRSPLLDRRRERLVIDIEIELALGDGDRQRRAAGEDGRDAFDEAAAEGVDRNLVAAVDLFSGELAEDHGGIAMGVDGHEAGELASTVYAVGVGRTDFDPCGDASGEIAHE